MTIFESKKHCWKKPVGVLGHVRRNDTDAIEDKAMIQELLKMMKISLKKKYKHSGMIILPIDRTV